MNRQGMMVDISHVVGQDFLRRAGSEQGAADRVAFLVPRALQSRARYDRRHDQGAGREGRRDPDQLREELHRSGVIKTRPRKLSGGVVAQHERRHKKACNNDEACVNAR